MSILIISGIVAFCVGGVTCGVAVMVAMAAELIAGS
jgi:hypothetical protein